MQGQRRASGGGAGAAAGPGAARGHLASAPRRSARRRRAVQHHPRRQHERGAQAAAAAPAARPDGGGGARCGAGGERAPWLPALAPAGLLGRRGATRPHCAGRRRRGALGCSQFRRSSAGGPGAGAPRWKGVWQAWAHTTRRQQQLAPCTRHAGGRCGPGGTAPQRGGGLAQQRARGQGRRGAHEAAPSEWWCGGRWGPRSAGFDCASHAALLRACGNNCRSGSSSCSGRPLVQA